MAWNQQKYISLKSELHLSEQQINKPEHTNSSSSSSNSRRFFFLIRQGLTRTDSALCRKHKTNVWDYMTGALYQITSAMSHYCLRRGKSNTNTFPAWVYTHRAWAWGHTQGADRDSPQVSNGVWFNKDRDYWRIWGQKSTSPECISVHNGRLLGIQDFQIERVWYNRERFHYETAQKFSRVNVVWLKNSWTKEGKGSFWEKIKYQKTKCLKERSWFW